LTTFQGKLRLGNSLIGRYPAQFLNASRERLLQYHRNDLVNIWLHAISGFFINVLSNLFVKITNGAEARLNIYILDPAGEFSS